MNSSKRTLIFFAVAAGSVLLAMIVNTVNRPAVVEGFSEVGEEFFPELRDGKATELIVSRFDQEIEALQTFSVKQTDDGLWVIPSHHDYPAEAEDRLARTAASMLGIRKLGLISRSKDDHERYGVAGPDAQVSLTASDEGDEDAGDPRGTRLTLKDSSDNALVDLIVGRSPEANPGQYYVREPEKNAVYIAEMSIDLSTKFSDWIEPDLLKVNQPDVKQLRVNRYSVDEQRGEIVQGDVLDFLKDESSKWTLAGIDEESEQTKAAAVTDLVRNLDELKIVGVRPKPEGLNPDLTVSQEVAQNPLLRQVLQADMARQGFFIARGPNNAVQLVSNEGELVAGTSNGVQYTLYFGEIARGSAQDIEVGSLADAGADEVTEADAEEAESSEAATDEEAGPRRYLLVKVAFDETLLGERPEEPVAPVKPEILNDAPADGPAPDGDKAGADDQPADENGCDEETAAAVPADEGSTDTTADEGQKPAEEAAEEAVKDPADEPAADDADPAKTDDPVPADADEEKPAVDPVVEAQQAYDAALSEFEGAKIAYENAVRQWDERSAEGRKRVEELSTRFSGWYYVISAESFEKFRLSREDAVEPKAAGAADAAPAVPGGLSIPGLGDTPLGLPPGGN